MLTQLNSLYDQIRSLPLKDSQSRKSLLNSSITPEKEFHLMFQTDPLKNLEAKIYSDFEGVKQEVTGQVRAYVEGRLREQAATSADEVLIRVEPRVGEMVREEVRREM